MVGPGCGPYTKQNVPRTQTLLCISVFLLNLSLEVGLLKICSPLRGSRCETTDGQKDQQYVQYELRPIYSHDAARPYSASLAPAPALILENDQQVNQDQSDTDSDPETIPASNSLMDTSNADKDIAKTSVYESAMNHLSSHANRINMSQTSIQDKERQDRVVYQGHVTSS